MEINKPRIKRINLGIELLRFLLCNWIVIVHCSAISKKYIKYFNRAFHVPTFFFLSFYFCYESFSKRNIGKIISRFQRLLIPYFFWPLIIFLVHNILFEFFLLGQYYTKLTLKDLYIQLIIGSRFHTIFWFQFNIIFISLFITIISFIFKKKLLEIFQALGVLSFYCSISGLNYSLFAYNRASKRSIGCLIEMIPLAILGCLFRAKNSLLKLEKFSFYQHILLSIIIYMLFYFDIFINKKGFFYPNVLLNIFASSSLFLFFASLPFENSKNYTFKLLTKNITKFTGGIYYIHPIYRDYLRKYSLYFSKRNYFSSFIIYIICYINCFLGNKLFKISKFKYLFL